METKEDLRKDTFQTKDYDIFQIIEGNRPVDEKHVKQLISNMTKYGNLTPNFPIVVNEAIEVIDGQHRIAALKELGWPVFYQVQADLGLDTVQGINQASKNWNWLDYANSFASQGNRNYKLILEAREAFGEGLTVLTRYLADGRSGNSQISSFRSGEFQVKNWERAVQNLTKLGDLREASGIKAGRAFGEGAFNIMNNKDYDHNRMVEKISKFGSHFFQKRYSAPNDYARELEEVYNFHTTEANHVRLF